MGEEITDWCPICPACGHYHRDDIWFRDSGGTEEMDCENCGAELEVETVMVPEFTTRVVEPEASGHE